MSISKCTCHSSLLVISGRLFHMKIFFVADARVDSGIKGPQEQDWRGPKSFVDSV